MQKVFSRRVLVKVAVVALSWVVLVLTTPQGVGAQATDEGLGLEKTGTDFVYFTYDGEPLLSFGTFSDFVFYAAEDAYDYKLWADWSADHGMNHARAYLPGSWIYVERFARENGGALENVLFPYQETPDSRPGHRQFDLTQFNPAYWRRFREQCEYLASKDIIIELLMINGWQLSGRAFDWPGHFFNPENNVNPATDHLGGGNENRHGFYYGVSDGEDGLIELQKAYFAKILEETHDLPNIYYDLVHEQAKESGLAWEKEKAWIEEMALFVREKWADLEPDRPIILGIDASQMGGFPQNQAGGYPTEGSGIDWVFSRPYFDVLIWGNVHHVPNARAWRLRYDKPYIPQESFDDTAQKWSYRHPEMRVHIRKYFWKMMMAKVQQMDLYMKPRKGYPDPSEAPPHNYDPRGWNEGVERDARKLRAFFGRLTDYPNLGFKGYLWTGPRPGHHMVLSSEKEAIVYVSSPTGFENEALLATNNIRVRDLALRPGDYRVDYFDPERGVVGKDRVQVEEGAPYLRLRRPPPFIDDLTIHIYRE